MNALTILLTACSLIGMSAFAPAPLRRTSTCLNQEEWSTNFGGDGTGGGMEEIEFTIHPDGRVTEVVRGVKGGNCKKLTESVNEHIGSVVYTENTEEMFEQELVVDNTISVKNNGEWDGASSW